MNFKCDNCGAEWTLTFESDNHQCGDLEREWDEAAQLGGDSGGGWWWHA